ncbi:MAG: nicotinate (nicotinamide) nucleotide adenylyltransferase [Oscillatoriaceae cyanobacterium Prado104]|jgi:nicotinate-nucleotide adenylyltransferase|nr:nicotinate (nicotinamide) nucleotide adenylyltransferase [Oscillatoriaceae cyanobacterium Prado104]
MGKIAIFGGTFDPVHWGHLLVAQVAVSQFQLDRVLWMPDRVSPHKSRPDLAAFDRRREMVALAIAGRSNFVLAPLEANAGTSFAIDTLLYLKNLYPDDRHYWIIGVDAFQTLPKWHRCAEIGKLCDWLVAPRPSLPDIGGEEISAAGMLFDGSHPQTKETGFFTESAGLDAVFSQTNPVAGELRASPIDSSSFPEGDVLVATSAACRRVATQMTFKNLHISWEVLCLRAIGISSSAIRQYCAGGRSIGCLVPKAVSNYIAAHRLYQI